MKFFKSLFGGNAEKYEDKGDELRLDFEYMDAAYYYQQALDALEGQEYGEANDRLKKKLRDVRRKAFGQLLEDATELIKKRALDIAREKLEMAATFADDASAQEEVARRRTELADIEEVEAPPPEVDEPVTGTEGDLYELALSGLEPDDRERALELGDGFRRAFEAFQKESWEEAHTRFAALAGEHTGDGFVQEMAAMAAEQAELPEEAEKFYRGSLEASPFRPATVLGLAALYRNAGKNSEARNLLTEAASHRPVSGDIDETWSQVHLEHAMALSEDGHHDEAISILVSLSEAATANQGFVYFNLAGVLERAGRDEDCHAALTRSIEVAPRQPMYRERLADFLVKHRTDLDGALALLVSANEMETTAGATMFGGGGGKATISPNRARYLYKIARCYFLKGEDLEAERTITAALTISRDPVVTQALESLQQELQGSPGPS
jgi:tetratricopeptide (TPR) repeat protein